VRNACLPPSPKRRLQRAASRRAEAREAASRWPSVLLEHPAVCEDPAVLLRLLAAGRALGDEAAAAAAGRLRLSITFEGKDGWAQFGYDPPEPGSAEDRARRRLCRDQAAFVERRGALLSELTLADGCHWHDPEGQDYPERPIERVLAPALRRAAAAGRLAGLRAVELPGFGLEGGVLPALALCPALTRLCVGTFERDGCAYVSGGPPSAGQLRAVGRQIAALRGLRELDLLFGCERVAAPAMAGLSALTRLTRLRLTLAGLPVADDLESEGIQGIRMTRTWSGLHKLPASLLDLTLGASCVVRGASGPRCGLVALILCAAPLARAALGV
jgi:hypothetical protein